MKREGNDDWTDEGRVFEVKAARCGVRRNMLQHYAKAILLCIHTSSYLSGIFGPNHV